MKTDRKLKRGLADLSKLFLQGERPSPKKQGVAGVSIEPPEECVQDHRPLRFVSTTFLQSSEIFQTTDLINLIGAVKSTFQETYLLSVDPNQTRYENFAHLLPIPPWESVKDDSDIHLYSIDRGMTFGYVSLEQFETAIQPKLASPSFHDFTDSKRALAVFDSVSESILELIDHCVFVVSADSNQLMRAYDQMRYCLGKNQFMRCSVLLTGQGAEALWEFVYERFSEIASKFLGCNLGFLGWMENGKMHLNPELLLEEGTGFAQLPSKIRLGEILHHPVLSE